ncbi:MAG TPA: riboflavin synthase [Verrucomicrobiae bacterium]
MFTGIIETTGEVDSIRPTSAGIELLVRAKFNRGGAKVGESIAVNGCCLTVENVRPKLLCFSVLAETWKRTNLQFAKPGAQVNLERALRVGDRLGGHFVSGHIDDIGKITRWEQAGKDYVLEISASAEVMRYMVFKGSVAVDGISLTVAAVRRKSFEIWIIPHTRAVTALRERRTGDAVNLETDMLGKFVERFILRPRTSV